MGRHCDSSDPLKQCRSRLQRIDFHDIGTFLHSCGALYDLLDLIVQTGTDILNPGPCICVCQHP